MYPVHTPLIQNCLQNIKFYSFGGVCSSARSTEVFKHRLLSPTHRSYENTSPSKLLHAMLCSYEQSTNIYLLCKGSGHEITSVFKFINSSSPPFSDLECVVVVCHAGTLCCLILTLRCIY